MLPKFWVFHGVLRMLWPSKSRKTVIGAPGLLWSAGALRDNIQRSSSRSMVDRRQDSERSVRPCFFRFEDELPRKARGWCRLNISSLFPANPEKSKDAQRQE